MTKAIKIFPILLTVFLIIPFNSFGIGFGKDQQDAFASFKNKISAEQNKFKSENECPGDVGSAASDMILEGTSFASNEFKEAVIKDTTEYKKYKTKLNNLLNGSENNSLTNAKCPGECNYKCGSSTATCKKGELIKNCAPAIYKCFQKDYVIGEYAITMMKKICPASETREHYIEMYNKIKNHGSSQQEEVASTASNSNNAATGTTSSATAGSGTNSKAAKLQVADAGLGKEEIKLNNQQQNQKEKKKKDKEDKNANKDAQDLADATKALKIDMVQYFSTSEPLRYGEHKISVKKSVYDSNKDVQNLVEEWKQKCNANNPNTKETHIKNFVAEQKQVGQKIELNCKISECENENYKKSLDKQTCKPVKQKDSKENAEKSENAEDDEIKALEEQDCKDRGGTPKKGNCKCGISNMKGNDTCKNNKIVKGPKDSNGVVSISSEELACDEKDWIWDEKTKTCKDPQSAGADAAQPGDEEDGNTEKDNAVAEQNVAANGDDQQQDEQDQDEQETSTTDENPDENKCKKAKDTKWTGTECVCKDSNLIFENGVCKRSDEERKKALAEKQQAYDEAKANEQSLANRTLTAASVAATGIGGMELAMGLSQQKADKEADQNMAAYIATMRCTYGDGKSVKAGLEEIELPGGNDEELMNLRTEYFALAADLKVRKEALGMKPGIESEEILDKAKMGLYDDEYKGIETGAYESLYRATMLGSEADQAKIAEERDASKKRVIGGAVAIAGGVAIGAVGNSLLNGKLGELIKERKNNKKADNALKEEEKALDKIKTCLRSAGAKDVNKLTLDSMSIYPSVFSVGSLNCSKDLTTAKGKTAKELFAFSGNSENIIKQMIERFGYEATGKMLGVTLSSSEPDDDEMTDAVNALEQRQTNAEQEIQNASSEEEESDDNSLLGGIGQALGNTDKSQLLNSVSGLAQGGGDEGGSSPLSSITSAFGG